MDARAQTPVMATQAPGRRSPTRGGDTTSAKVPRASVALLCLTACAAAPKPSPRVMSGDRADLLAHLTLHAGVPLLGDPGLARLAGSGDDQVRSQLSPDGYWRAGVRVIIAAVWVPPARAEQRPMDALRAQTEALRDFAARHPRFAVVRSVAEARRAIAQQRVAVFIGIEGADLLERVEDVDVLLELGVRMVSLAHLVDTPLIDAEDGQFGAALRPVLDGSTQGLTPLGRAVVTRAIERGLLIDVTYASPRGVDDLIVLHTAANAPLVASHVGSGMLAPRTLDDAQARALVQLGGLIGVGLFRHPLLQPVPPEDTWRGFVPGTCDEVLAHQRHFARLVGEDAVVLGSDLGAPILRPQPGGACPDGVRGDWDLPALFEHAPFAGSGARVLALLEALEARRTPRRR